VQQLQQALRSRDVIGQAKGVLMVTAHLSADEAFQLLVRQSQRTNRKLVEVAAEVVRTNGRGRPSG
jgi:AmiR/NasT family two-component response regulator